MTPSICHELWQLHLRAFCAYGATAYILDPAAPAACRVNKKILGVVPLCICHKVSKPAVDGTCNAHRFLIKIGFRFAAIGWERTRESAEPFLGGMFQSTYMLLSSLSYLA